MTADWNRFGDWLRWRREKRGLTQEEIGVKAAKQLPPKPDGAMRKIGPEYVSNIENGRRNPPPDLAMAFAVALDQPKALGLFMAAYVPARWLEGDMDELEERFFNLGRLAMGSPVVASSTPMGRRTGGASASASMGGTTLVTEEDEAEEPDGERDGSEGDAEA